MERESPIKKVLAIAITAVAAPISIIAILCAKAGSCRPLDKVEAYCGPRTHQPMVIPQKFSAGGPATWAKIIAWQSASQHQMHAKASPQLKGNLRGCWQKHPSDVLWLSTGLEGVLLTRNKQRSQNLNGKSKFKSWQG